MESTSPPLTQLTLRYPLKRSCVELDKGVIRVDLGNNIILIAEAPPWLDEIVKIRMDIVMEVEGAPPDAQS